MKTTYGFSKRDAEEQGKYRVILNFLIIVAILALMILTEFGSKFYK